MLSQHAIPEFAKIGEFYLEKFGCHTGKLKCLFCRILDKQSNFYGAGTLHAQSDKVHTCHVGQFTEMLQTKVLKLNETQVLTQFLLVM